MIDIFIALTILAFWVIGRERGLIQEIADIVAIIGGFLLAMIGGAPVGKLLYQQLGGKVPEGFLVVLSSVILFLVGGFLILLIASALEITARRVALEWLNKLLGGLVGAVKGLMLWWLIFVVIMAAPISEEYKRRTIEMSIFAQYFLKLTPVMYSLLKGMFSEVQRRNLGEVIKWRY